MVNDNNFAKEEIKKIVTHNKPIQTGIIIQVFPNKVFDVHEIPLELLKFNPYNDRIASWIKSYEYQHKQKEIDWFSEKGQAIISDFLWDSDSNSNNKSKKDIEKNQQHTFAIINNEGLVIDGNRRLCILKRICSEINYKASNINSFNKLKAVVLDASLSQAEIMRLETAVQMGQDEKLDYQPIEKYLKVNKLIKEGFSEKEIASLMNKTIKDIINYQRIYTTMENYLNFIEAPNQFQYIKTFEDHFINLTATLQFMKKGQYNANWNYDEVDIFKFQEVAFNYIRSGYEGKKFRKLLGSPNIKKKKSLSLYSPFSNEDVWIEFEDKTKLINNRALKIISQRNDLIEKIDEENCYKKETFIEFDKYLELKTDILKVTNERFKGEDLMQLSYEYINRINNILVEINITPNFKKNFNKIKELIPKIEYKIGQKNDD